MNEMKFTWTMIKKDLFGLWEVTVLLFSSGKEYTFTLKSEQEVDEFKKLLRFNPGKAFNFLKERNVKVEN
jgi:hypothetical protein